MQTYLLTLSYHGRAYAGWQRQAAFPTVQEKLEDACARIFGEPIVVHGSGRTDAGVHALGQTAHLRVPRAFPPAELLRALNGNLPMDIAVRGVRPVPARFHARFSAAGKRYLYRFWNTRIRPVHGADLHWWVRGPLDLAAMRAAGQHLLGEQDFAALATNPGYERKFGTVRTIQRLHLIRRPHGLDLLVQGDGFLYNMVRAIAGTLQEIGLGKYPPSRMREILDSRDRSQAGMTAPACGLYLLRVLYPASALCPESAMGTAPGSGAV